MTSRYYPNLRRTEQRKVQIEMIQEATGTSGFASAIDYALAVAVAALKRKARDERDETDSQGALQDNAGD